MVKINKIYTRTGDEGDTGLVGGERVRKDSLRVAAYGDVDELNAILGWARTLSEKLQRGALTPKLTTIQNELFDLGAELATPPGTTWEGRLVINEQHGSRLEHWIDELVDGIPELRSFVLPGGSELNAALHLARTVCRRAERSVVTLMDTSPVSKALRVYLNRLSDLLFAMARYESHQSGCPEYLWVPGKDRP
jgi:cob(I)alamin adenosyltransferase